jgi:hypothetical protein
MLQLSRLLDVRPRCMLKGVFVGAVGGLVFGGLLILSIAYSQGGMNVEYIGNWAANQAFQIQVVTREVAYQDQRYQKAADEGKPLVRETRRGHAWAVGISFVITILLFVAKTIWVGFPLHPVGYILANTHFINMVWGSLLVALIVKFVALRAGGVRFVRSVMTPFFVGVFLGAISSYLFWDAVALVLNAFGHMDAYHVNHVF